MRHPHSDTHSGTSSQLHPHFDFSFLRDKGSRRYTVFLSIFCLALLLSALAAVLILGRQARDSLLLQEGIISSSLLEQGVDPAVIAQALSGGQITEKGRDFLQAVGHTDRTPFWLLPSARQSAWFSFLLLFIPALLLCALLLLGTYAFWMMRERLYAYACTVLGQYAEGNFSLHLPCGETGTLFRLFLAAEQLSTALQAQMESEHAAKEFLKDNISHISHQLKTPLAALQMYMEIISAEPDNRAAVSQFAHKAAVSLERMERLILTLLKMMRLDAGSVQFSCHLCAVRDVAEQAVADLRIRTELEGKYLVLDGSPEETMSCDEGWTAEAIGNLVKNALDHTDQGGTIRLAWRRFPHMLQITVEDNGCGIPPEDIHHIFKRFYQGKTSGGNARLPVSSSAEAAAARRKTGAGLGLPLAKSIIEGQGGILTVQSTYGEGTVFTVSFLTEP